MNKTQVLLSWGYKMGWSPDHWFTPFEPISDWGGIPRDQAYIHLTERGWYEVLRNEFKKFYKIKDEIKIDCVIYEKYIKSEDIRVDPSALFIFGDNLERRGFGGQAKEMRGHPNSFGIATKNSPTNYSSAYFSDKLIEANSVIQDFIDLLIYYKYGKFNKLVIPSAGIGTGLAHLESKSPIIFKMIKILMKEITNDN